MYTFKKEERLCNKRLIDGLYHNGSSFLCYPFKATWCLSDLPAPFPAQVLFAVSKKRFKRAVDRNRVKRLMREAYRADIPLPHDFDPRVPTEPRPCFDAHDEENEEKREEECGEGN